METCESTSIKKETLDSVLMHDETPLIKEEPDTYTTEESNHSDITKQNPIHTTDLTNFEKEAIDPLLTHSGR